MAMSQCIYISDQLMRELEEIMQPGESIERLLVRLIEHEKEARLVEELERISEEDEFVEFPKAEDVD